LLAILRTEDLPRSVSLNFAPIIIKLISNPSQNITITGGTGINVLNIKNTAISSGTVTFNAPHGGSFIMNVSGSFALSGTSRIVLAGGITASDVLYNFVGSGGVAMSGGSLGDRDSTGASTGNRAQYLGRCRRNHQRRERDRLLGDGGSQ
jgi:hypothetical protein